MLIDHNNELGNLQIASFIVWSSWAIPIEDSTISTIAGKTFQLAINLKPISQGGETRTEARRQAGIGARGGKAGNEAELQKYVKMGRNAWIDIHQRIIALSVSLRRF